METQTSSARFTVLEAPSRLKASLAYRARSVLCGLVPQ